MNLIEHFVHIFTYIILQQKVIKIKARKRFVLKLDKMIFKFIETQGVKGDQSIFEEREQGRKICSTRYQGLF